MILNTFEKSERMFENTLLVKNAFTHQDKVKDRKHRFVYMPIIQKVPLKCNELISN